MYVSQLETFVIIPSHIFKLFSGLSSKFFIHDIFFLFITPGYALGLLMALHSGSLLSGFGTTWDAGNPTWIGHMQGKCLTKHCTIAPVPQEILKIVFLL